MSGPRSPSRPIWPALPIGAGAGALGAVVAAMTSPELYTDWGSFAGALVVVPLFAIGAAALVSLPLALLRRIGWVAVPLALVISVAAAELVFQATLGTRFARWSAGRHWSAVERRAAAEREAADRDVCRRLMAEPPIPPPPAPAGAAITRSVPSGPAPSGGSLMGYNRKRCEELLRR